MLQGLLAHAVLKEAAALTGPYARALDRVMNTVAGSGWRLTEEGRPSAVDDQEPQFSTWEDVMGGGRKRTGGNSSGSSGAGAGARAGAAQQSGGGGGSQVADTTYYQVLGVAPSATAAEIKAAYRQAALRLHPDVNAAPDATERFAEVATAYGEEGGCESKGCTAGDSRL